MQTRLAVRIKLSTKISLKIEKSEYQNISLAGGNEFDTIVFDISKLGVGIYSNLLLPKDLLVEMSFDGANFDMKNRISINGKVTYCKTILGHKYKYACGIKFLDPHEKNAAIITGIINK